MADIYQWRRMIQPARVRTPVDEQEPAPYSLKSKLSTTFAHHATAAARPGGFLDNDSLLLRRTPSWAIDTSQDAPNPELDQLANSMMTNVLNDPYSGVTASFASDLLRLLEGYRSLKEERQELSDRLEQETKRHVTAELEWERERQEYKAEVKRLEVILEQGKRGLAEVTLARQDSELKRARRRVATDSTGLETILELLERTKQYEDKTWGPQRALMRRKSPSSKMRRLSKQLTANTSPGDLVSSLPSGTPVFAQTSFLPKERNDEAAAVYPLLKPKASASSDDTFSTFASMEKLFPGDFAAPQTDHDGVRGLTANAGNEMRRPSPTAATKQSSTGALQRLPSLRTKASGLLAKFRPQLAVDVSVGDKFSFEAGDDAFSSFTAAPVDNHNLPAAVKDRLLRKSASMSSLGMRLRTSYTQEHKLPPVVQSPTSSAAGLDWVQTPPASDGAKRRSRIPTPVHRTVSLVRHRRERDDSSSSLLTAIRQSEDASRYSSSAFSSPSGSRIDLTQGLQDSTRGLEHRSIGSGRLPNHGVTDAVAKTAAPTMQHVDQEFSASLDRRSSTHGSSYSSNNSPLLTQSASNAVAVQPQKENRHPMKVSSKRQR